MPALAADRALPRLAAGSGGTVTALSVQHHLPRWATSNVDTVAMTPSR
jgi:hypothetical protein